MFTLHKLTTSGRDKTELNGGSYWPCFYSMGLYFIHCVRYEKRICPLFIIYL